MKRRAFIFAGVAALVAALASSTSAAAPKSGALVIRHQLRGCHSWSLNGGPYGVGQVVHLSRGGSLTVTNNDLMAQELVQTSGPAVEMALVQQSHMGAMPRMQMGKAGRYTMGHMGAVLRTTFAQAGVYRFKLVDRGDYVEVKTAGPDHELSLTVDVA